MTASSSRGFICEKLYKAFVTSMEWINGAVFACCLGQAVQPSVHFMIPSEASWSHHTLICRMWIIIDICRFVLPRGGSAASERRHEAMRLGVAGATAIGVRCIWYCSCREGGFSLFALRISSGRSRSPLIPCLVG